MGAIDQRAHAVSRSAEGSGALVPLSTALVEHPAWPPFQVRRLLSRTPKHLRAGGPRPNPFLPWEPQLEVQRLGDSHLVLLNKYPVQRGHLLVITQRWQPQSGWLERDDWRALGQVEQDSRGLWFFNSCAAAGASQPHRHLQLLPRGEGECSCPLAPLLEQQLAQGERPWPWAYRLSRRQAAGTAEAAAELDQLYRNHAAALQLGSPEVETAPRQAYNLLFDRHWLMTVRRTREHWAGFSVNALGFAGYLLITERSELGWLEQHGPWQLLRQVAVAPVP